MNFISKNQNKVTKILKTSISNKCFRKIINNRNILTDHNIILPFDQDIFHTIKLKNKKYYTHNNSISKSNHVKIKKNLRSSKIRKYKTIIFNNISDKDKNKGNNKFISKMNDKSKNKNEQIKQNTKNESNKSKKIHYEFYNINTNNNMYQKIYKTNAISQTNKMRKSINLSQSNNTSKTTNNLKKKFKKTINIKENFIPTPNKKEFIYYKGIIILDKIIQKRKKNIWNFFKYEIKK